MDEKTHQRRDVASSPSLAEASRDSLGSHPDTSPIITVCSLSHSILCRSELAGPSCTACTP